jgi:hypothetical protein
MNDNRSLDRSLDDDLANMTDRLLAGEEVNALPDNQDLGKVVRQLRKAVVPSVPDAAYRARLTQRLNEEWDKSHRQPVRRLLGRPLLRFAILAACVVVVLTVALLAWWADLSGTPALQGAALGPITWVIPVLLIVALFGGVLVIWRRRR